MTRSSKLLPLVLLLSAMLIAHACGGTTETPNPSPTGTAAASAGVPGGSTVPGGSGEPATPSDEPASQSPSDPGASPTPTATAAPTAAPTGTMIVRAYFLLDESSGNPTIVPVLRTVPESKGTARAALRAVLAGPTSRELGASPAISTRIPEGTRLLGVSTASGVATVNLSGEFAHLSSSFSARARVAQVVYTLTQFSTIDSVRFEIDGQPVTSLPPSITLDKPVGRATYRGTMLPDIFVDRPAWGAALRDGGRVNGVANVFEAQFRLAVLDARGKVLVDEPVQATCGLGCWGTFDLTVSYSVTKAQWGTLRVWDPSERDGSPTSVREYPVWLAPG
jgi:germination protein M